MVVTMGCGDVCPVYPGKRYEDWDARGPGGSHWTRSDTSEWRSGDGSRHSWTRSSLCRGAVTSSPLLGDPGRRASMGVRRGCRRGGQKRWRGQCF